jgi:hypothetical protein
VVVGSVAGQWDGCGGCSWSLFFLGSDTVRVSHFLPHLHTQSESTQMNVKVNRLIK